jgi:hypothetical protein
MAFRVYELNIKGSDPRIFPHILEDRLNDMETEGRFKGMNVLGVNAVNLATKQIDPSPEEESDLPEGYYQTFYVVAHKA